MFPHFCGGQKRGPPSYFHKSAVISKKLVIKRVFAGGRLQFVLLLPLPLPRIAGLPLSFTLSAGDENSININLRHEPCVFHGLVGDAIFLSM